ncbi:MAG: transporter substrate-binding domain-containing protein, partial [Clostridiaceae bacterium]|nr:transporter substrate-binding domain-containing protein [Clostridiaceae bacterium]
MCISWRKLYFVVVFFGLLNFSAVQIYAAPEIIRYEGEIYPPIKFEINGIYHGFEIELNKYLFDENDYKLKYSKNNWDVVYDNLRTGKIDTCGMLAIVGERNKDILYSDQVMNTYIAVYVRKGMSGINMRNLKEYRIGVGYAQYTEEILRNKVGIKDYKTYPDIREAIDALSEGEIDVLFENQEIVNHYLIEKGLKGYIAPIKTHLYPTMLAYGVSRDNTKLVNYINKRLVRLKKSGVFEELYQKYFYDHSDYYEASRKKAYIAVYIIALIFFVLLQIYIRQLKKKVSNTDDELKKQHDWLRITLTSIGDAIITTDEKGLVTFVNDEGKKLFDISDAEFMGKSLEELFEKILDEKGNPYEIPLEEVIKDDSGICFENKRVFINNTERL